MRKILLLSIALLLTMGASAQVVSDGTKDGVYVEVVNSELSKVQLWSNLKRWVATTFVSYKHTVDMEDKDAGTMIVKYNATSGAGTYTEAVVNAVLQVDVKENKYRIKIYNPSFKLRPNSRAKYLQNITTTSLLENAKIELKAAENVLYMGVGSYEELLATTDFYKTQKEKTPKYLKPKDEEKGKVNPEYLKYEKAAYLCEQLRLCHYYNKGDILYSLQKVMKYNDDF